MAKRKSLAPTDLPDTQWEWAVLVRELLLELKLKCKDPMHLEHLALVDEWLAMAEACGEVPQIDGKVSP